MADTTQRPDRCGRIALVLQGGGALGAYQAGVYEALHGAGVEPDWISGVSIGAINAAIIAGNPRERRIERLTEFWTRITSRSIWGEAPDGDVFRQARNVASAFSTMVLGQPGFFTPREASPWLSPAGAASATSFYDSGPLRATLEELVDFDRLNHGPARFSVGAVNVVTGNYIYFDTASTTIGPEHIMASGALPPAFAPVRIAGDHFWDGGIVSNTPLQHLFEQEDDLNALIFQVDLFNARGPLPRTIDDVLGRQKDIMYSSRTRQVTDMFAAIQRWKSVAHEALKRAPDAALTPEDRKIREDLANLPAHTIIQLIYQQKTYEGTARDYEFSSASMREHWESGRSDTVRSLGRTGWLQIPPPGGGVVAHDIHRADD